jgi:hypothetical protein
MTPDNLWNFAKSMHEIYQEDHQNEARIWSDLPLWEQRVWYSVAEFVTEKLEK